MNLQEFRFYYPEYDGVEDGVLADALYEKYYAGKIDRQRFNEQIGLPVSPPSGETVQVSAQPPTLPEPPAAGGQPFQMPQLPTFEQPATPDAAGYLGMESPAPVSPAPPQPAPIPSAEQGPVIPETPEGRWSPKPDLYRMKEEKLAPGAPEAFVGIGETLLNLGTGVIGGATAGIAGLTAALVQRDWGAANDVIQEVSEGLTYEPKTEKGKQFTKVAGYPFEKLRELGDWAQDKALESGAPTWEAALWGAVFEVLPFLTARKGGRIATEEVAPIIEGMAQDAKGGKSRGQLLKDLAKKNPELFKKEFAKEVERQRADYVNLEKQRAKEAAGAETIREEARPVEAQGIERQGRQEKGGDLVEPPAPEKPRIAEETRLTEPPAVYGVPERKPIPTKGMSFEDMNAEFQARAAHRKRVVDHITSGAGKRPVVLLRPDGKQGVIIHKSTKRLGKIQKTTWDRRGFIGDDQNKTMADAIEAAIEEGFTELNPAKFDEISKSRWFLKNTEMGLRAQEYWRGGKKGGTIIELPPEEPPPAKPEPQGEAKAPEAIGEDRFALENLPRSRKQLVDTFTKEDLPALKAEYKKSREAKDGRSTLLNDAINILEKPEAVKTPEQIKAEAAKVGEKPSIKSRQRLQPLIDQFNITLDKIGEERLRKNGVIKEDQSISDWLNSFHYRPKSERFSGSRKLRPTGIQELSKSNLWGDAPEAEAFRKATLSLIKARRKESWNDEWLKAETKAEPKKEPEKKAEPEPEGDIIKTYTPAEGTSFAQTKKNMLDAIFEARKAAAAADADAANYMVRFVDPSGATYNIINMPAALDDFMKNYKGLSGAVKKQRVPDTTPKPGTKPAKPPEFIDKTSISKLTGEGSKGWTTDGSMMIKDSPPKGAKPTGKTFDITPVMKDAQNAKLPAQVRYYAAVGEEFEAVSKKPVTAKTDELPPAVVIKAGKKRYSYDQRRYQYIINRYPKASLFVNPEARGMLVFKENGEPVAVLIPKKYSGTKQKDLPNIKWAAKKGMASVGRYAETDKAKYAEKEPPKEPPKPWGSDKDLPPIVELPELVQIAKALGEGKYPKVVKKIGRKYQVAGAFFPSGKGRVEMRAAFESVEQFAKTLAHEIGHWVDYLPEQTMSRGNILGRLASLKKYMKKSLPLYPGAPGPLTPEDRARIKKQAADMLKADNADKFIDEVIRKKLPISPDDVLQIWRAADPSEIASEDLYDYIKRLSGADKKSIVLEAMRGRVPKEVQRFAKVVEEKTGKKIKYKPSDEEIRKKYQELIKAETVKRRVLEAETIYTELRAFTRAYKPFEPAVNPKYTKYRYSGPELYADFFSGILNDPYMVRQYAPNAWDGFFNYLDSKPIYRDLYQRILDEIYSGKVDVTLSKNMREMFRKGDLAYAEKLKGPEKNHLTRLHQELFDSNSFILRYIRGVKKKGLDLPPSKNPLYALEDMMYSMAEVENLVQDYYRGLHKVLIKENIDYDLFGEYLFYRRVANPKEMGGRAEIANPLGVTPDRAKKKMADIQKMLGPDKTSKLNAAVAEFRRLHEDYYIERAELGEVFDKKTVDMMRDSVYYATWDVFKHMKGRYGSGPAALIKRQIGTFDEVTNPVTATIMKDIAFLRFLHRNTATRKVVEFMREYFPKEIKLTPQRYVYKGHEFVERSYKDKEFRTVYYWQKGQVKAYDVPIGVADAIIRDPIGLQGLANALRMLAKPHRMLFTEFNPGFIFMTNPLRDYMSAVSKLPKAGVLNFAPSYLRGLKKAWKSVEAIKDETIEEMRTGHPMLISVADWRGLNPEDRQIERLLAQYHMSPGKWNRRIRDPFWRMLIHLSNAGRAMERATKVGSYLYLKKNFPEMAPEETAHLVRHFGGSPSFLTMGRAMPIINNLLLFANPMVQGYRSEIKAFKRNPYQYSWKKIKYVYSTKALIWAAELGLLGAGLQLFYSQVSEYDKANYIILPIGFDANGKSVYFRVPLDEGSRVAGGIFYKTLAKKRAELFKSLMDYTAGQVPSIMPMLQTLTDISVYASGKNPYDYFRGRYAIPEQIFKAGGKRSHEYFLKYLAKQNGAGIVYRFETDDLERIKTDLEKLLNMPLSSNIIGRLIKVSDQGESEQYREVREAIQKELANRNLDIKEVVIKIVNGEQLTKEDVDKLIKNPDIIPDNLIKFMARQHGLIFMQNYTAATSTEEKAAVLMQFLKINQLEKKAREGRFPPQLK